MRIILFTIREGILKSDKNLLLGQIFLLLIKGKGIAETQLFGSILLNEVPNIPAHMFNVLMLVLRSSLFAVFYLRSCNFIKKRIQHWCFPAKFSKILKTSFLKNTCGGWFWILNTHIWLFTFSNCSLTSALDPNSKIMIKFVAILILCILILNLGLQDWFLKVH